MFHCGDISFLRDSVNPSNALTVGRKKNTNQKLKKIYPQRHTKLGGSIIRGRGPGSISSRTANVEYVAAFAWRIHFAENTDRLGNDVKHVQYSYEWATAYLFTNMNWSPKQDFNLIARDFERANLHFCKNSLI